MTDAPREPRRGRAILVSLAVAAVGGAGVAVVALSDPGRAMLGWLAAYGFGLGTSLGALILAMVFHVTFARWPIVLRPYVMSVAGVTPIFALLFVPFAIGMRAVVPSVHASDDIEAAAGIALEHQRMWNHPTFFIARAVVYLGTWSILSIALRRADALNEREPSEAHALRQRRISAAGLPILALTMTFASFDWFMSAEPGWVSDMYGLYFFAGGLASAVSLVAIVTWLATRRDDPERAPGPDHYHALGRLMLMAVVFWAYIAFFQLMLVWIANLPREVGFYVARSRRGYEVVDGVLLLGHFVLPFVALLSRPLKRRPGLLVAVAAWLVLMDAVDVAWLVMPAAEGGLRVLDIAPFLLLTGVAVAYGMRRFDRTRASTAPHDPSLDESLRYRSS